MIKFTYKKHKNFRVGDKVLIIKLPCCEGILNFLIIGEVLEIYTNSLYENDIILFTIKILNNTEVYNVGGYLTVLEDQIIPYTSLAEVLYV